MRLGNERQPSPRYQALLGNAIALKAPLSGIELEAEFLLILRPKTELGHERQPSQQLHFDTVPTAGVLRHLPFLLRSQ